MVHLMNSASSVNSLDETPAVLGGAHEWDRYIRESLGLAESENFVPNNIANVEILLGRVTEFQRDSYSLRSAAEFRCAALREYTETQCQMILAAANEQSEGPQRRADSLLKRFGLLVKSVCIDAINQQKKLRSFKFANGSGVASLKKNASRFAWVGAPEDLLAWADAMVPDAVPPVFTPLTDDAKRALSILVDQLNTGETEKVIVKKSVSKSALSDAVEFRHTEKRDEASGIITENSAVYLKGTFETVPAHLVKINGAEKFTLSTPFGEVDKDLLGGFEV